MCWDNVTGPKLTTARPDVKVRFATDVEVRAMPAEQNQREPIKMVSGFAWSPGIYQALRLLGKPLDVAWERDRSFSLSLLINNLR